jgi:spermidine/putrescine transport system ATP-binding protein
MASDVMAIRLEGIVKRFGDMYAVRDVTLGIREGEFFSLLGPSGCGKTTTLRMIAGFEDPDEGRILLRDQDVSNVPPEHRPVNMVFQQYALFPHMSVFENIAFGLKIKKVPKGEREERVREMLRIMELQGMESRRPHQLSGGQQQRVALARALVNRPAALLLDEPLGALDVKLRKQMQLELKRIQHALGTTFVYVTHDQEEAMAMSDRIAVMNLGRVEQVGSPREIYEEPASHFVADFVGLLNKLEITVQRCDGHLASMQASERERIAAPVVEAAVGERLLVAVRPERVRIEAVSAEGDPSCASRLEGTLADVVHLGTITQYHVDTGLGRVIAHRLSDGRWTEPRPGARVAVSWDTADTLVLEHGRTTQPHPDPSAGTP